MVHVIRFADVEGAATPDHMKEYTKVAGSVAVPNGVRIDAWLSVEGTILGDGRSWHQVRFNTFPSRAAFMAVASDSDRLAAQKAHRDTAIAEYLRPWRATVTQPSIGIAGPRLGSRAGLRQIITESAAEVRPALARARSICFCISAVSGSTDDRCLFGTGCGREPVVTSS